MFVLLITILSSTQAGFSAFGAEPRYRADLVAQSSGSCSYIRLDKGRLDRRGRFDTSVNYMSHVPVQDQGSLGICYSEAAAQMVDAYRFSHGDTDYIKITAPLVAAIDTGEDDSRLIKTGIPFLEIDMRRTDLEGGFTGDVVNYLRAHKPCNANAMPRFTGVNDPQDLLDKLGEGFQAYQAWQDRNSTRVERELERFDGSGELRESRLAAEARYARDTAQCLKNIGFTPNQIPQLSAIQKAIEDDNPLSVARLAVDYACRDNRFKVNLPEMTVFTGSASEMRQRIDERLDLDNPQPTTLAYCANVLEEGADYESPCRMHASLIIGRRFNPKTKSCDYLVRNSWGTDCDYAWDCEGGNIWVGRDALLQSTDRLEHFQ